MPAIPESVMNVLGSAHPALIAAALASLTVVGLLLSWLCLVAPAIRWLRMRPVVRSARAFEIDSQGLMSAVACAELSQAIKSVEAVQRLAAGLLVTAHRAKVPSPAGSDWADEAAAFSALRHAFSGRGVAALATAADGALPTAWAVAGHLDWGGVASAASQLTLPDLVDLAELGVALHQQGIQGALSHAADAMGRQLAEGHSMAMATVVPESIGHAVGAATEISHHVGHAAQHVDGGDVHGHIPVVTIILSSMREVQLLANEKTTVERALVHVAVDAGAVAAGSAFGAKGGAALGTMVLPGFGTAIGALVGGVAGAVVGKATAGELKAIPLRQAVTDYNTLHSEAMEALRLSAGEIGRRTQARAAASQRAYDQAVREFGETARAPVHEGALSEAVDILSTRRAVAASEAVSVAASIARDVPTENRWTRRFGLSVASQAQLLHSRLDALLAARLELLQAPSMDVHPALALGRLAAVQWPNSSSGAISRATALVRSASSTATQRVSTGAGVVARVLGAEVKSLAAAVQRDVAQHRAASSAWRGRLQKQAAEVRKHQAALGG